MKVIFKCKDEVVEVSYSKNMSGKWKWIEDINVEKKFKELLSVITKGMYSKELIIEVKNKEFIPKFYPNKTYSEIFLKTNFTKEHSGKNLSMFLLEFLCLNDILKEEDCNTSGFNFLTNTSSIEELNRIDESDYSFRDTVDFLVNDKKIICSRAMSEFYTGRFTLTFSTDIETYEKLLAEVKKDNYDIFLNQEIKSIMKAYTIDKMVYDPINKLVTITAEQE